MNYAVISILTHNYLIPFLTLHPFLGYTPQNEILGNCRVFLIPCRSENIFSFSCRKYNMIEWVMWNIKFLPQNFTEFFSVGFSCFVLQKRFWKPISLCVVNCFGWRGYIILETFHSLQDCEEGSALCIGFTQGLETSLELLSQFSFEFFTISLIYLLIIASISFVCLFFFSPLQ